jgi:ribonuclease Z
MDMVSFPLQVSVCAALLLSVVELLSFHGRLAMKIVLSVLVSTLWLCVATSTVQAAPCLIVTVTGSMGGPPTFNGLAGPGTLVRYGDDGNNCNAVKMQFDAGRGTNMRLSQVGVPEWQLNAVFFTHMHTDHTEGFADILQLRWHFNAAGPKIDVVCSSDVVSPLGFTMSCKKFALHIADAFIQSGEIAQRLSEVKQRLAAPGGPADLTNVVTFEPKNEAQIVWSSGDVKVSAIRSTHVAGHASYRVDTPAGSVVIGGDAGNDTVAPPRASSTSDQVEELAKGADIIVHSTTHPIMAPDKGSGMPPLLYYRQSNTSDLGAMAKRAGAKYLVLTHLSPPIGAERQGPFKIPGGALTEADYRKAVQESGFTGNIVVGTDLASIRLPAK